MLSTFVTTAFILFGIFIALSIIGWDETVSSLLAGAGIAGLIIGLALQDSLSSAIAGVIMSTRRTYRIGDLVKSNNYFGVITQITLRHTTLKLNDGVVVKIPNKLVLNNPLENFTLGAEKRIDITCGISYNEDLNRVLKLVKEVIEKKPLIHKGKEVEVFFTEFADSSINFLVRFWIEEVTQASYLQAQSDAIVAIKNVLDANNISIPFPIHALEFSQFNKDDLQTIFGNNHAYTKVTNTKKE